MAAKSDFAQKLLGDLRMRKERMVAAQNSSRQSTQTSSRAVHGNTRQTSSRGSGSGQTNTSRRHGKGNTTKPINTRESSNQMVLYGNGQKSSQHHQQQLKVRDLSMAIAFAFESSGNLTNIAASTTNNNPLANFFNRFNRRSRDTHKTDITAFGNRSQIPSVSNIHITEVSKGVQKLNQILQACSNGFSLDGKELLKGAIDLEESLRMLVELQEGSQYGTNTQENKSRLRLLDDDEDDENAKIAEQWKLDRPKFSFDKKPVSGAKVLPHKRSASYVLDLSLSSSSHSVQLEKRGISNVVAKLMGLEEISQNEDFGLKKNDSKAKVSKQSSNLSEPSSREINNRQSHVIAANPLNGDDSQRKQNPEVYEQRKRLVPSNTELQKKGKNSKTVNAAEYKAHDRIRHKLGANAIEKDITRNQHKHEVKVVLLQEHVPKRGEPLEDPKGHKEKKDQHFQRQISKDKNHESMQVKSIIPSKPKKSTPVKKKLPRDEATHGNVKSTKCSEEVPTEDPKNKIHQVDVPVIDIAQPNKEHINVSTRESQLDMENKKRKPKDNQSEVSAKQNKVPMIPKKIQRSEIPQKIDVLMSRRNPNHLTRSIKQPADTNMLKDLKQRLHSKNRISKKTEEQRHDDKLAKDEKAGIIKDDTSEDMHIHEQVKKQEMLRNENEQRVIPNTSIAEEYQIQKLQKTSTPKDRSDTIALFSEKASVDYWKVDQELKQRDRSIENNIKEEITELYTRQEQLTEPETELKEIIIKSQTLLSTADALFKLNIPVGLLHAASEQQEYYEAAENRLILNCANEVMRRKARRQKVRSLDDLIRKLCMDMETLKCYGGDGSGDVATRLHKMVERDIYERDVDVNCMWEFEWRNIRSLVEEKEDVVRDVERWVLNGLVDEVTDDLILVS